MSSSADNRRRSSFIGNLANPLQGNVKLRSSGQRHGSIPEGGGAAAAANPLNPLARAKAAGTLGSSEGSSDGIARC